MKLSTVIYWAITAILLYLLLTLPNAKGGGSGDYPYSGSGDWVINQETYVWDESYDIDGDLYIWAPLYLDVNVTLNFIGVSPSITIHEPFHIYNSTVEGASPVDWSIWLGELFFNHSTIRNVDGFPYNWRNNFVAQHSTFEGDSSYIKGISHQSATNLTFLNNSFYNFTEYGISLDTGCNDTTIKDNKFINCTDDYFTYNSTNLTITGNQYLWYLHVELLDALRQPIELGGIYLFDKDNNALSDHETDQNGQVNWILINQADSPITIVAEKHGNLVETTITIESSTEITLIMDDYIPTATINIHFYNTFTGLGEDSELLKVFYQENNGTQHRTSNSFSVMHATGKVITIEVKDYFNISVATSTLTLTNLTEYHVDFAIPLATLHLTNTYGLNDFTITRQGSSSNIQMVGHEIKVIANYLGNSTIIYTVSWNDTYVHIPHNDTRVLISNGSFSFPAEASDNAPHIIQDISSHIEAQWEEVISPEEAWEWWNDARLKKILIIIGVMAAIAFLYARYAWVKRKMGGA